MGVMPWDALFKNTVGLLVNKARDFIPDPVQKATFALDMRSADLAEAQEAFSELKAQLDVNAIEAASDKWWKAGWRPFFGWTCGAAFAYKFVVQPFLVLFILQLNPHFDIHSLPEIDWTALAAVALPMLGLSRDRSNEKQAITSARVK